MNAYIMNRFEGKAVLVTGAASGIGAACVRRLLSERASIAAADLDQGAIDRLVSELGVGERIYAASLDVADSNQKETFVGEAKKRFGSLHAKSPCATRRRCALTMPAMSIQ